jgi:hypothetical protein
MWRDARFWAAANAAPVYWGALYLLRTPTLDLRWPLHAPLAFLLVVLVYPVLEEIVFRGLVQESARKILPLEIPGPVSFANLITSTVFAGLHVVLRTTITGLWVFFPSLVFGYFKDRYRTLTAPILLHVFYNGGFFLLFHTQS